MNATVLQAMMDDAKECNKRFYKIAGPPQDPEAIERSKQISRNRNNGAAMKLRGQIEKLMEQGLSNTEMSRALGRSRNTIQYHAQKIRAGE